MRKKAAYLLTLLVTLLAARCVRGQTPLYLTCPNSTLSIPVNDNLPVLLGQTHFQTGINGESAGVLDVRVGGNKSVVAVALAIQFDDKNGEELADMAYVATTEDAKGWLKVPLHTEHVQRLSAAILGGETLRIQGVGYTVTDLCPASGRLLFLVLLYSDQSSFSWSLPGWRFGPVPRLLPKGSLSIGPALISQPMAFIASVEVSSEGRISRFSVEENIDAQLTQQLRDQVSDWTFFPATEDGKPVRGHLVFLFRITP
jgi:hypothetical protein